MVAQGVAGDQRESVLYGWGETEDGVATVQPVVEFTHEGYRAASPDGRYGVLVDPAAETIWIHRRHDGSREVAHTFGLGRTLLSLLLGGFDLDVDDVFSR